MENEIPKQNEDQSGDASVPAVGNSFASEPSPAELTDEQKLFALAAYLVPLVTSSGFIAPLIIWLLKKDQDDYVEYHAKESLNLQITILIYALIAWVTIFLMIGMLLLPAVIIAYLVFAIIASVKAYQGEKYRVPICIRFVK